MNIRVLFFFQFWFLQGICLEVVLLGHMVVLFLVFLRKLHTVFHSGCINLHFHQQCRRVTLFSTPSLTQVGCGFFDYGHSVWCDVISHCGLICIFLIMSGAEHLFMGLLSICMSSLKKFLLRSFAHFLIGLFVFMFVLSCVSCLCILEFNPLSVVSFAIIFSHSEACLFTLFIVSFAVQKLLSLIRPVCLFLFLFPLL